jgi:acyl CoA:acetate/3-ketoacid CoA transferase
MSAAVEPAGRMRRQRPNLRPDLLTRERAAELITSGSTLAVEGSGGGVVEPTALLEALGARYASIGEPGDLTLVFCAGIGDKAGGGLDKLAQAGLVRRAIGGHFGMNPNLSALAAQGAIEAFNFPQGVLAQLYREIAAGRPGVLTRIGLGTFCDPRLEGGRLSPGPTQDLVSVVELDGREWLLYRALPIDFGFIRATTSDELGNLTLEHEVASLSVLALASACHNSGGKVIAQVERLAAGHTLRARDVVVPGHLVDAVVVVPDQPQTLASPYEPGLSGEFRAPWHAIPTLPANERTVIARRAAAEVTPGAVLNVGVGMADGVAPVLLADGRLDEVILTVEQGLSGGLPAQGLIFGAVWNPDSVIDVPSQFDLFDGGGLDLTCLGFAEVDREGNVNASRVGEAMFGAGGFINISQSARTVVFCGTLTAGGLETRIGDGALRVVREGRHRKFVDRVHQVTFSAARARQQGQRVMYITERAVFELGPDGPVLTEIGPGLDLEADVLSHMDFRPAVASPLRTMPSSLFAESQ